MNILVDSDSCLRKLMFAFTEVERLRDDNKYFCDTCLSHVEAERSLHYQGLPNILTLHLKRFSTSSGYVLILGELLWWGVECCAKCCYGLQIYWLDLCMYWHQNCVLLHVHLSRWNRDINVIFYQTNWNLIVWGYVFTAMAGRRNVHFVQPLNPSTLFTFPEPKTQVSFYDWNLFITFLFLKY